MIPSDPPLAARCGATGKFFSREEIVDHLLHVAAAKQYKNPFWLSVDHPRLKSGFLELKPEERASLVPLVSLVFPACRIPTKGAEEPRALLHPNWVNTAKRQPGMNAFTGRVSSNPFLVQGEFTQGWATLDQLVTARMQIHTEAKHHSKSLSFQPADLDSGTFVVLHEFALYNAEQLEKPGRLALMREEDRDATSLFQPLF